MAYVFVADDFTGASDTLGTLARGGLRARLFRDVPEAHAVAGLDAWGVATHARSLGRADIVALATRIGECLKPFAPDFLHVKVCSTFDSGPETGNTAAFTQTLADTVGIADIAVMGGQPSLGRHAVFATLFARGPDGRIHRIDRHPVMSVHPVTPMHEADLIRHLGALGLNGLYHVGIGQKGGSFPRFYDVFDQTDVEEVGRDLLMAERRLVVMGASSVAEAWLAARARHGRFVPPANQMDGPVFAFAGSRSALTTTQIGAARELARLPLNPADVIERGRVYQQGLEWARERMARGQDSIVYLTAETTGDISAARLAHEGARFVSQVLEATRVGGLVVAGGDTSSAIVNALAPDWLDYAGEVCAGVPILRAQIGGREMSLVLKGGQMGANDFFQRSVTCLRG